MTPILVAIALLMPVTYSPGVQTVVVECLAVKQTPDAPRVYAMSVDGWTGLDSATHQAEVSYCERSLGLAERGDQPHGFFQSH